MDWKGIKGTVLTEVPMKRYTSMRVGGPAQLLLYPAGRADFSAMVRRLADDGTPYRFLGNGTNIVVSDEGIRAALIRITKMNRLHFQKTPDGAVADVGGGYSLKRFISECAKRGLGGLEKLYWIPGSVGGGIRMNAGSFGQSISDTVIGIDVLNRRGEIIEKAIRSQDFGYRTSPVGPHECVISGRFRLRTADVEELESDMDRVYRERKERHPMEYPSAGSVFKAVQGRSAWWFVEKAGLRGYRIGDACVSEKHTNFIVNLGHARARDIAALIEKIKQEVHSKLGVKLEEEVELWGFNG
ncbi:MAG: UDP-N-acetylmuramate dehydrogenase [Syntrophorhabdaceae bacterium]|nr:UDP-N-acetylmuramate dehydrogenase [Syntrophorhabdaceae bacterium]